MSAARCCRSRSRGARPTTDRRRAGAARGRGAARPRRAAAPAARTDQQGHLPSLLKQDQPVTVTSNRLEYDGAVGHAVYTGNARLWQGDTEVHGDTIIVDDKTGQPRGRTATCGRE